MVAWKQGKKGNIFLRRNFQTTHEFIRGCSTLALENVSNEPSQPPEVTRFFGSPPGPCQFLGGSLLDQESGDPVSVLALTSYVTLGNSLSQSEAQFLLHNEDNNYLPKRALVNPKINDGDECVLQNIMWWLEKSLFCICNSFWRSLMKESVIPGRLDSMSLWCVGNTS